MQDDPNFRSLKAGKLSKAIILMIEPISKVWLLKAMLNWVKHRRILHASQVAQLRDARCVTHWSKAKAVQYRSVLLHIAWAVRARLPAAEDREDRMPN